ncbi:hypothetical protein MUBE_14440, partial [Mycobacterium uberis]
MFTAERTILTGSAQYAPEFGVNLCFDSFVDDRALLSLRGSAMRVVTPRSDLLPTLVWCCVVLFYVGCGGVGCGVGRW